VLFRSQKLKATMGAWNAETAAGQYLDLLRNGFVEIDGVRLEPADVDVGLTTKEGFAAAGERVGVVVLETTLDDELRELGFLRELQSKVQGERKDQKLEFADRIVLGLEGGPRLAGVLAKHTAELAKEVLAVRIEASAEGGRVFDVEGEDVKVLVTRASKA
jgi:isoleucyl-tRNA synthetase